MMISNEMTDYIIAECERRYNLEHVDLDINNKQSGKLKLGWKKSDLKLTVEFSQQKIASIIYHSFLDDFQRENMTEDDFTARFNDILAVRNIETSKDFHDIINRIIKSVNSGKIFGSKERNEIILDSEYRAKLRYIKVFFGEKAQEGKLFEELQELQEAVKIYKDSFFTKNEDHILEEIADCLVVGIQLNKTKLVLSMIKGIVEKSSFINTTAIEKIIDIAKGKINRTITRIEAGEYGALMITDDSKNNSTGENIELSDGSDEIVSEDEGVEGNSTDDKAKVLLALSDKTPWTFRSKELAKWTGIKAKECTKIIEELIKEKKIIISKKGKDGLYGATLDLAIDALYETRFMDIGNGNQEKKNKSKVTSTVKSDGSAIGMHAKGKE